MTRKHCLLSIKSQVSLAMEQNSSLAQDKLASRKNYRVMVKLTKAIGIPNLIEEDFEKSAAAMAISYALQFPGML